jgi:hypothetical protein
MVELHVDGQQTKGGFESQALISWENRHGKVPENKRDNITQRAKPLLCSGFLHHTAHFARFWKTFPQENSKPLHGIGDRGGPLAKCYGPRASIAL